MSHFSVMVRVPANTPESELEEKIAEMMIPYKEYGCGDDDPPELQQYLEFEDEEDEYLKSYDTETCSMVRFNDGQVFSIYDDRFRGKDPFSPGLKFPEDATKFEMPLKERYSTFEKYMAEYCGYKRRDPKKGRYGRWRNPNQKWDGWTIGGRWTGHFQIGYDPAKDKDNYERCWLCNGSGTRTDGMDCAWCNEPSPAGHPVIGKGCNGCHGTGWEFKFATNLKPVGNITRISAINWDAVNQETVKKINTFWDEWEEFCNGKEFSPFDGPRDRALRLGLIECKDSKDLTGQEWKVIHWKRKDMDRCDVLKQTTRQWLIENHFSSFSPLYPFARLDKDGWQEKGTMGWFGCSTATPDSSKKFADDLLDWIKKGNQEDFLVILDCHI